MQYRTLGKTGMRVSQLSFGASSLGGVFRETDEAQASRCVRRALELGINYIDVAPYYGLTRAETVLGKALKGVPRDSYYLATKVGRYGDTAQDFDYSAQRVAASIDESLSRLGVAYVDVIQCHDVEFVRPGQVREEAFPALTRARAQGKVRFIGVTALPLHTFKGLLDQIEVDTVLSYCRYTLNDRSLEHILPYFQQKCVGIINASPLGMGLLSHRGPPHWHPASPALKACCASAAAFCSSKGIDLSKLALQFSLSHPGIHTTLVGSADPRNIENNVRWAEQAVDHALLKTVCEFLRPVRNQIWQQGIPQNYPRCVRCHAPTPATGYVLSARGECCLSCR